jgi:hypothetical protein
LLKPIGRNAALLMLGFNLVQDAIGGLTFTSGLLPRALGVLMAIAGACYLTISAARILSPWLASILFPSILVPAFIGELLFAVWLTVKGVNVARWQELADRAAQ